MKVNGIETNVVMKTDKDGWAYFVHHMTCHENEIGVIKGKSKDSEEIKLNAADANLQEEEK